MTLHKKEEAICDQLGDRAGFAISYHNQGAILRKRKEFDNAMNLQYKAGQTFKQLGMSINLAQCLGEQAKIQRDGNKPEEALKLAREEESICKEFGNRPGLARSWWTLGSIYQQKGEPDTQAQLWRKSIELKNSMGIPTGEDKKKLEKLMEDSKE